MLGVGNLNNTMRLYCLLNITPENLHVFFVAQFSFHVDFV